MDRDSAAQVTVATEPWSEKPTTNRERIERVLACLRQDARAQVRTIARRTLIPPSTVSHAIRVIRLYYRFMVLPIDVAPTPLQATPTPADGQPERGC
ncbi:MAG: winged helix-turn-helix domain-containing protein [Actinomycetota bacterium]|nr:winged helix-turn-helix domain-containing protein [Actinomycetota bacterium]